MRWPPALLVLAACTPQLAIPRDALVRCGANDACPDELVCRNGYCIVDGLIDETPPLLVNANALALDVVVLSFNERMQGAIEVTFSPPLVVEDVSTDDGFNLRLRVLGQRTAQLYGVRVDSAFDLQGNSIEPASAETHFFGFGATPNRSPPDPLAPLPGESVARGATTLAWSPRALAFSYTVEVAKDDAFMAPMVYELTADQTSVTVSFDEAVTFYWRVRADVTNAGEFGQSHLEVLDGVIYVYCPPGGTCDDTGLVGNRSKPFRTVNRGMTEAAARGFHDVLIAGRAAGEVYAEQIVLIPGINLHGGYTADFSARGNPTVIDFSRLHTVIAVQITTETLVEELTFDGSPTITVMARGCTDALEFRRVTLRSRRPDTQKAFLAQQCPPLAGPQLIDCVVETGFNGPSPAVEFNACGGRIERCRITGDSWPLDLSHGATTLAIDNYVTAKSSGGSAAISADGSEATIVANRVDVGLTSFSMGIEGGRLVANNIVCAQTATTRNPVGIAIQSNDGGAMIVNNTLCGTIAAFDADIVNNVVSGAATGACATGSSLTLSNNAFIGCTGPTTNGNVAFALPADAGFVGYPLDVHLRDDAPLSVRTGGLDASSTGVITDRDGKPRTCNASDCFSMGAFEW